MIDPVIDVEWARIPHFYKNFYVYQCATGFSAANALAHHIRKPGMSAVNQYLDFLKCGSAKDPITLLKEAGVEIKYIVSSVSENVILKRQ
ncbi:M3 family metallopeptidase [Microaerobacter geothermalis]|uniref:M3 family metallopeptidase n=1 Tax=Microaerobacter geothermalis TaxID=674972 RepID=UPI002E34E52B|nr:M3 family metallopeptidase [Microaerobacter geothermalis]